MTRKSLLIAAPVLILLLLAGAWALLRHQESSSKPIIGSNGPETSAEIDDTPIVKPDAPSGKNAKTTAKVPGPNETARKRLDTEQERIKAEQHVQVDNPAAPPGKNPPSPSKPKRTAKNPKPDNRTPRQKALDAERQRRIAELKKIKRPPNQSLGNLRPRSRKLKETGKKNLGDVSPKLMQDRRGLYAKYYAFTELPINALLDPTQPQLDDRTPDITRIDRRVYFPSKQAWNDLPFDKTNFMGVWTGFLVIPETGDYWLYLGADYTGMVTLDGQTVLLNDLRDYTEVSTVLSLSSGLHPIRIDYMEGKNGSPVDDLAECNFMWVPEGKTKPVPVPPEMLMLPEELWSDSAPIVTKLSKYSGEIGDEITISGQNFAAETKDEESLDAAVVQTRVSIAGQDAEVLDKSKSSLRVRVPVGAQTGKLIVYRRELPPDNGSGVPSYTAEVPSNSVDFTVTTQFGLYASWHNLQGWSNYGFIDESVHKPDVTRLERDFMFETRDDLDLAFRNNPLACHWEGKLGIPAGWVKDGQIALVRFQTYGRLRVKLGDQIKQTTSQTGGNFDLSTMDFEVRDSSEHYLPLSIDFTSETGPAGLTVVKMVQDGVAADSEGKDASPPPKWKQVETLQPQLFFPPVIPPKPPEVLDAKPIFAEGEQPPTLPYDVTTTRPSIREGQECEITLKVYGDSDLDALQSVSLTIDGLPLNWSFPENKVELSQSKDGGTTFTARATLPAGLGEGSMVARQGIVTSEPFLIDVQNKGLISYLYDLPNPGGYTKMPDLEPMTCFEVRKMPWVNYENANQFNVPFPAETFAIEWFGALIVEKEGDYRFTCRSDDGIYVWLDGNLVLVDDNLHYQREKSSDWIHLVPGTYNFRMQYFENNVHEVSVLSWEARTDRADDASEFLAKTVIPKRCFTWDQHPALPQKTTTHKRSDGSDEPS